MPKISKDILVPPGMDLDKIARDSLDRLSPDEKLARESFDRALQAKPCPHPSCEGTFTPLRACVEDAYDLLNTQLQNTYRCPFCCRPAELETPRIWQPGGAAWCWKAITNDQTYGTWTKIKEN